MKQKSILSWMTIVLMAFVCVAVFSCSKSDDNSSGSNNPLVGTWTATGSNSYYSSWVETLAFTNNSGTYNAVYTKKSGGTETESETFNYSLIDYNNGSGHVLRTLTSGGSIGKEDVVTFVINNNHLTFNGFGSTFTKK